MLLPKGSIVEISNSAGIIGQGALADDVTIGLTSNFRALAADFQNEITEVIDMVGSTAKYLLGKGFSSQFKQMTAQIWSNTDPAFFQLNVDFHRVPLNSDGNQRVSSAKMMEIVKKFCSIPLPAEGLAGNLEPPGPSPIVGIGLDALISGKGEVEAKGYVDVTIGSMKFNRLLMRKAEPTFNKYVDDDGYPISCRVSFDFISLWAATKEMINGNKNGIGGW